MATRENQGLQIALILFVMITVALAVTTFVYYRKSEETIKEAAAAVQGRSSAEKERDSALFQVQALKFMIGAGEADLDNLPLGDQEMKDIVDRYRQDMAMYGQGLTAENLNYRNLPENLVAAIRDANQLLVERGEENRGLVEEKKAVEEREIARTAEAVKGQQRDGADLVAERAKFNTDRTGITQKTEQLASTLSTKEENLNKVQATASREKQTLTTEVDTLSKLVEGMKQKVESLQDETYEIPDGRVTWVNQKTRIVWINVGLADGLRRQTTFSVYDQDESGVLKVETKGSIEVTRIMDQHLAEARIIDDDLTNPILPGDVIHSPAWRPGRKVLFALAGLLDVDGDGKSDRTLVRNLITMSGGVITAEVHEDGTGTGQLAVNTRYLIKGDPPGEQEGAKAVESRRGYSAMIRDAAKLSIEEMSIDKFLSYMGWRGEAKTVPLGAAPAPRTFRPGQPAA